HRAQFSSDKYFPCLVLGVRKDSRSPCGNYFPVTQPAHFARHQKRRGGDPSPPAHGIHRLPGVERGLLALTRPTKRRRLCLAPPPSLLRPERIGPRRFGLILRGLWRLLLRLLVDYVFPFKPVICKQKVGIRRSPRSGCIIWKIAGRDRTPDVQKRCDYRPPCLDHVRTLKECRIADHAVEQ